LGFFFEFKIRSGGLTAIAQGLSIDSLMGLSCDGSDRYITGCSTGWDSVTADSIARIAFIDGRSPARIA